jgi:hypothetical protein
MHRVITKVMDTQNGIRKRHVDLGPWQPSEATARRWADYLERTGRYDSVTIQSNGQSQSADASDMQLSDEDLFLEAGN